MSSDKKILPLGVDDDGNERYLPDGADKRHIDICGGPGEGKSHLQLNILKPRIARGAGSIVLDNAGRIFTEMTQWVAHYADELGEAFQFLPRTQRQAAMRKAVFDRFVFGYIGSAFPNVHAINPLARLRLPNGRLETTEEVVSGAKKGFDIVYHDDIMVRSTFNESLEYALTALVAGEMTYPEADTLITEPSAWQISVDRIVANGILNDSKERAYIEPRMEKLRGYLDTRFRSGGKDVGSIEAPPYKMDFQTQWGSTIRALKPFLSGSAISKFFSASTFSPERMAFGNGAFFLSTNLTATTDRVPLFAHTFAFWERALRYRTPGLREQKNLPRTFLDLDDCGQWLSTPCTDFISVARNFAVSCIVAHQDPEQFKNRGMAGFEHEIESLCELEVHYRQKNPSYSERLALRFTPIAPMAMTNRYTTTNQSENWQEGKSNGTSTSESEGTTEAEAKTVSTAISYGENEGTSKNSAFGYASGYSETPHLVQLGDGSTMMEMRVTTNSSSNDSDSKSTSSGSSRTETDGEATTKTHGRSSQRGTTESNGTSSSVGGSKGTTEQLNIVSASEQLLYSQRRIATMDRHQALFFYRDQKGKEHSVILRVSPFTSSPTVRDHRPVYRHFLQAFPRYARRRTPPATMPTYRVFGDLSRSQVRKAKKAINFTKAVDQKEKG